MGHANRPPEFVTGGDLSGVVINENTPVGTIVYNLRARDPEGQRLFYYMSGDSLSVDKNTGAVKLIKALDRESESALDLIVTVTDEKTKNRAANTVSVQREVKVGDANDNVPTFSTSPYSFTVSEATHPFTTVFDAIFVNDADTGVNAQVSLECLSSLTPVACDVFHVHTTLISEGKYKGSISLKAATLNYESISQYSMTLMAKDRGGLNSTVHVTIDVTDVQDEPPRFLNAPYAAVVAENTPTDTAILNITARDGEATPALRRPLKLYLINDRKKYFDLKHIEDDSWILRTTQTAIDREDPEVLLNNGVYEFGIKAIELVNGKETGDTAIENITITVKDINDQKPRFSFPAVKLIVSEDVANDSAVPGFNLIVFDSDTEANARFSLQIQDADPQNPASAAFAVSPDTAVGRALVVLKVINADLLDYEQEKRRAFHFNIIAAQGEQKSVCAVTLIIADANDHYPVFDSDQYHVQVPENAPSNVSIFSLRATDLDSNEYGEIRYSLSGPGSEMFFVNADTGEIGVASCGVDVESELDALCLDFETQSGYSLMYSATDGGGKHVSVKLTIEVLDMNDNAPIFQKMNTSRVIFEGDKFLDPPLRFNATDQDGPAQGGNEGIRYFLKSSNLTGLYVDAVSGEVKLATPVRIESATEEGVTTRLNYEITVRAVDAGIPPMESEITITFIVRSERDGAPVFLNEPYNVSVYEDAPPGTPILLVTASDPDGNDEDLRFSIISGSDNNFVIDEITGDLVVSPEAVLDRDTGKQSYTLTVSVVDGGYPRPLTTTTSVNITIQDVNNKSPQFTPESFLVYMSESELRAGKEIVRLTATDLDSSSKLRYMFDRANIVVRGKTGFTLTDATAVVADALRMDPITGSLLLVQEIRQTKAATIVIPVRVVDENAQGGAQFADTEVTIYIQANNGRNPVFIPPWTPSEPNYEISLPEETVVGSTLITLTAKDPVTSRLVTDFEKILETDANNRFSVNPSTGVVSLKKRIDYEDLPEKQLRFSVKAKGSNQLFSVANIVINVQDINDFSPVFSQQEYSVSVLESAKYPEVVTTVKATDKDTGPFGVIRYSMSGDGSHLFEIHPVGGTISIRPNVTLDREVKDTYSLQVSATDNQGDQPLKSPVQRSTSVLVRVKLIDVNDNRPKFERARYEAVVPENAMLGFIVGRVHATDRDEGRNGEITYELVGFEETPQRLRLFSIDEATGIITVSNVLSGKGRREPYVIEIRANDHGTPQQQFTDVQFLITIGDIAANDGIPVIVRPAVDEVLHVSENSKPGTFVYQVEAVDPDNPVHPNGKVMYKFLDPVPYFDIDPQNGIITTASGQRNVPILDREQTENFTLILVAYDLGIPPQEAHRVVRIRVTDVDDNDAFFDREKDSPPLVFEVREEVTLGSEVARVKAIDLDVGYNAAIAYEIINGNEKETFTISSTNEGHGVVKAAKRLDREADDKFLLTIRATSPKRVSTEATKFVPYNKADMSQIQIEIFLKDIDDNPPMFELPAYVVGVKYTIDVHSHLATFKAHDPDLMQATATIRYTIHSAEFVMGKSVKGNVSHFFELDANSGVLRNSLSVKSFVGGYFNLAIRGTSIPHDRNRITEGNPSAAEVNCKIFILRDKDFLKFTFKRKPDEIKKNLKQMQESLATALKSALTVSHDQHFALNFDQVQFLERSDGSLDFESSTACFQLIKSRKDKSLVVDQKEGLRTLQSNALSTSGLNLKELYETYGIVSVEECTAEKGSYKLARGELGLILIGLFIAVCTIFLICVSSSMKKQLKEHLSVVSGPIHPFDGPMYSVRTASAMNAPYGIPFGKTPSFISVEE